MIYFRHITLNILCVAMLCTSLQASQQSHTSLNNGSSFITSCIIGALSITSATLALYAWHIKRSNIARIAPEDQLDALDIIGQQDEKATYERRIAQLIEERKFRNQQLEVVTEQCTRADQKNASVDMIIDICRLKDAGNALQGMCNIALKQKKESAISVLQSVTKYENDVARILRHPNFRLATESSTFQLRQQLKLKDPTNELTNCLSNVRASAQKVRSNFKIKYESSQSLAQKKHSQSDEA